MRAYLTQGLADLGVTPPEDAIEQLMLYCDRLIEQNTVMNLTAITEPQKIAELHFLDSAALLSHCDLTGCSLIDVGTGAGFPGVVLKILCPSLQLTLLDSLNKRLLWLEQLCSELGLTKVQLLHGRAEECGHTPGLRDHFDFATARAVAPLPMLCELCLPFVRPGGFFLAMKSTHEDDSLPSTVDLLSTFSSQTVETIDYTLPGSTVARRLLRIEKGAATPDGYPRKWSKIKQAKI